MATIEQAFEILPRNLELLDRKCGPQHHYSDVIDPLDLDALETISEGSKPYDRITLTPLEDIDPDILTFLADHIRGSSDERIDRLIAERGREPSFIRRLDGDRRKATVLAFNESPRNEENTREGANGPPFFLALTGSGVEVVSTLTTLPKSLGLLAEFNGVQSLFRVVEDGHPLLDGNEQFRSQYSGSFRNFPDFLRPVYQYETLEDLIAAKELGEHKEEFIVIDSRDGNVVYEDIFGNLLIRQADGQVFRSLEAGDSATLEITHGERQIELPANIGTGLKSASLNEYTVYQNVDRGDGPPRAAAALLELIVRVDDKHPKQSINTAGHRLRRELGEELDLKEAVILIKEGSPKPY